MLSSSSPVTRPCTLLLHCCYRGPTDDDDDDAPAGSFLVGNPSEHRRSVWPPAPDQGETTPPPSLRDVSAEPYRGSPSSKPLPLFPRVQAPQQSLSSSTQRTGKPVSVKDLSPRSRATTEDEGSLIPSSSGGQASRRGESLPPASAAVDLAEVAKTGPWKETYETAAQNPLPSEISLPLEDRVVGRAAGHSSHDALASPPGPSSSPKISTPRSHAESSSVSGPTRTMSLSDVVEIRQSLYMTEALRGQCNRYYEDEQLFKSWITAETCLRQISRSADRITQRWGTSAEAQSYVTELKNLGTEMTSSKQYDGISTKMKMFMEVLTLLNLQDRFDFTRLDEEPIVGQLGIGSKLQSRGSNATETFAGGAPSPHLRHALLMGLSSEIQQQQPSSVRSTSRHPSARFFKLSSSKKKEEQRKMRQQTGEASTMHSANRRSIFHRRRGGAKGKAGGPEELTGSPASVVPQHPELKQVTTPTGAMSDEKTPRGLAMTHLVNNNGSISVSLKVKLKIALFRVLAILNEVDYYDRWVPYCKKCVNLKQLSRAAMVIQQICEYPWPIKQKENLSFCFGIDALDEFGCVMILSYGIPDDARTFLGCAIPPPQKKVPRVASSTYLFILRPVEDGVATVLELHCNVDPGISIMRSIMLPIVKLVVLRSVRGFFQKIGYYATNFVATGYQAKVNANPLLYEWLQRRIQEGADVGRFKRAASAATLLFDELR